MYSGYENDVKVESVRNFNILKTLHYHVILNRALDAFFKSHAGSTHIALKVLV